ncbi:MAG: cytochrome c peroxidase [Myxococcota bacterium]
MKRGTGIIVCAWLAGCGGDDALPMPELDTLESLGEALFSETALSANRTQSCATCHNPDRGFIDDRLGEGGRISPVSLGDNGVSYGDRNAPSAAYAAFAPAFELGTRTRFNKQTSNRLYEGPLGGLFYDGRATSLEEQAAGPPLSAVEMGMPSKVAIAERLAGGRRYQEAFNFLFGPGILDDPNAAYEAMTQSIAAYERTELFSPFDSKYDRFLRGDDTLSFKELTGRALFFSEFANCGVCHQLHNNGDPVNRFVETFTGYEYHNIGIPVNDAARTLSGASEDLGLESALGENEFRGLFRTPTLRNIAVTEPYMHNGVFQDLRTVIEFYDHFNNPDARTNNPETNAPWRDPENPETVATNLLRIGRAMSDLEVESMVCFLRTLTDARYEALIEPKGIDCAN